MRPQRQLRQAIPVVLLLGAPLLAVAEENVSWALKDPDADGVEGTRTERVYADVDCELHLRPPERPIVVAVIDSGLDIEHPDLKDVIWTNPAEAAGKPGVDDDGNGFIDDLHGWNFIGARDRSRELIAGRLEVTRELARLERLVPIGPRSEADQRWYEQVRKAYAQHRQGFAQGLGQALMRASMIEHALAGLAKLGLTDTSPAGIKAFTPKTPSGWLLKELYLRSNQSASPLDELHRRLDSATVEFDAQFAEDFDESALIGDDPAKLDERGYGNPQVRVLENAFHGTHVAGIIGAVRGNGIGVAGQCAWVRIMPVRAVPDGDERDKDVANAVRYAVDNGARIINTSFGKDISPDKPYVDAAFRYAAEKNVLVVHAAGNAGADNDIEPNFPNRRPLVDGPVPATEFPNWIEVGASSAKKGSHLIARFSNYGATSVDILAPGTDIVSTVPGGGAQPADGTSMAAPEVAGVAALVWSQHPELTAVQLKQALLANARRYPDLAVIKPGTESTEVPFASLSVSGGIVDAWLTLKALRTDAEAPAAPAAAEPQAGPTAPPGAVEVP